MKDSLKTALDCVQASERLKRRARAHIRRKTFDYGRNVLQYRAFRSRVMGGLLTLALLLTGSGLWFLPATSIGLDVNPSLELQVNVLDRVIALRGINDDGRAVAEAMDVAGMPYDDAMQRILISREMEPYLEKNSLITITVVGGGTQAHAEEMLSKVVCRAYAIAEDENVIYCQVDKATRNAAREAGLCTPRYLAWQQLLKSDPTVTAEDVRSLPREEIRALAQLKILENPCGE